MRNPQWVMPYSFILALSPAFNPSYTQPPLNSALLIDTESSLESYRSCLSISSSSVEGGVDCTAIPSVGVVLSSVVDGTDV